MCYRHCGLLRIVVKYREGITHKDMVLCFVYFFTALAATNTHQWREIAAY